MTRLRLFMFFVAAALPFTANAQKPDGPRPPTPVIVSHVERISFADEVEALGTLKARESVDLASSVTELVTAVLFTDNQRVTKGDVLVEMDAAEELAELEEQKSFLAQAQRQVERLTPLVKKGAASAAILDENKREVAAAQARINAIQSRINQRIIKAPYDGVLGLRNISVGALAQPGSMITTIDDDSIMKLDFSVPEVFLSTLKKGVSVSAKTNAYSDQIFKGEIASIDSRIDPVTRSIQARALIENPNGALKPGLLMHVVLEKNPRQALVVQEEALISDGPDNYVMVVVDKDGAAKVERRKVKLGERQFGIVEILDGLEAGDQVVTHGTLRVRPGAEVQITAIESKDETLKELLNQETKKESVSKDETGN